MQCFVVARCRPLVLCLLRETDYEVVEEEDTTLPSFSSSVTTITLVEDFELLVVEPPKLWRVRESLL